MDPCLPPEEVAARLRPEQSPESFVQLLIEFRPLHVLLAGPGAGSMHGIAGLAETDEGVFLGLGTGPLHEVLAMVPAGIPRCRGHSDLAVGTKAVQVVADEAGLNRACPVPGPLHQLSVEVAPEIGLPRRVAEPAAVVAIRACSHQRRKITPLGSLGQLSGKPVVFHTAFLGIGEVAVANDDHDLGAPVAGYVRPVAQFAPAHGIDRFDVVAVDQHITVAHVADERDQFHGEAHLGRPETAEARA